jgi:hypothetical protein
MTEVISVYLTLADVTEQHETDNIDRSGHSGTIIADRCGLNNMLRKD